MFLSCNLIVVDNGISHTSGDTIEIQTFLFECIDTLSKSITTTRVSGSEYSEYLYKIKPHHNYFLMLYVKK